MNKYTYSFKEISNVVVFGGGDLAVFTINLLLQKQIEVGVVTSKRHAQDIVSHDGKKIAFLEYLKEIQIPYDVVKDLDSQSEWQKWISERTFSFSISAEWIFRQKNIFFLNKRLVNIHTSLLPDMKGGGGLSWNTMMQKNETGTTIHFVDQGVDTGDIILQEKIIFPDEIVLLNDKTAYAFTMHCKLLESFWGRLLHKKEFLCSKQDLKSGSYWPRLSTDTHGYIDWKWSSRNIVDFIRAFSHPHSGAKTFVSEKTVRLYEAELVDDGEVFHPFQIGLVYRIDNISLWVATVDFSLMITDYEVGSSDRCRKVSLGDRFYTPQYILDEAMRTRIYYKP